MQSKPATQNDWKTMGMPKARANLKVARVFSSEEMERIKYGLIPEEMEDKWFIYYEGDRLYFHRSWTGHCIYVVEFQKGEDQFVNSLVQANRDAEQYAERDDEYDTKILFFLIDLLLLGRAPEFPVRDEGESLEDQALLTWSLVGRAMSGDGPGRHQP
jgi:hypothetical protein